MEAEEVVREMRHRLDTKGWCFLECSKLDGDIITIIDRDLTEEEEKELMKELGAIYEKHPEKVNQEWLGTVYTLDEIGMIADSPSLRLIHEAKKLGATIEGASSYRKSVSGDTNTPERGIQSDLLL